MSIINHPARKPEPARCTPWCWDPGHPNDTLVDDRTCMSDRPGDTVTVDGGTAEVYASRRFDGTREVTVAVEGPSGGAGVVRRRAGRVRPGRRTAVVTAVPVVLVTDGAGR
ncbi:MAG TPA: hypothetical protein VM367_16210, partial [Pseudonocardia sp.]|nr:hypothetical protein [Pseudonocardia sp.]